METGIPRRVAVFLDGRPGHEKQTWGILQAIQRKCPLEIVEIRVSRPNILQYFFFFLRFLLPLCRRFNSTVTGYDLLIGTGTHTHLPMLLYKKKFSIPAVTCMTPASYVQNKFDLIFSPMHDRTNPQKTNIIKTIGPPNTNIDEGRHDRNKSLILIGGIDDKSHYWHTEEIVQSVESLLHIDSGKNFTISSSPRTPAITCNALKELEGKFENVTFYHFRETEKGWVERQYQECENVWVTGDSISMVYEALSSGCRVGILPVDWKKEKNKFKRSEAYLKEKRMVMDLEAYLSGGVREMMGEPIDDADRCAEAILKNILWKS